MMCIIFLKINVVWFFKKKNEENNGMLYFGMCFIKMKLILDMVIFYIENFV